MLLHGQPGERIGYAVRGEGLALVLLHDFLATCASFEASVPSFAERFTTVTVDLLGHGMSNSPNAPVFYGPEAAARRVVALLDSLHIAQALLVGHGLGGAVALRVALDHPTRVAGLVLAGATGAIAGEEWMQEERSALSALAARVRQEGTGLLRSLTLFPGHGARLSAAARKRREADFDLLTPVGVACTAEGLAAHASGRARAGELSTPVLLLGGQGDTGFASEVPGFVGAASEGLVTVMTVPGAGHWLPLEKPAAFEQAIFDFAEGIGFLPRRTSTAARAAAIRLPALAAAWALLSLGGLALLGAGVVAFQALTGGDDDGGQQQVAVIATATPRPATATVPATPPPSATPTAASSPTASPTAMPTVTATPTPEPSEEPVLVPTPTPSSATPTPTATPPDPTPTPSSTPTPSGPFASISGPSTAGVGGRVSFVNTSGGGNMLRWDWTVDGQPASPGINASDLEVTFAAAGCHSVGLTVYFSDSPNPRSALRNVAVGGAVCP